MTRATAVAVAALTTISCAAPLLKLPVGPGVPAPDAERALTESTSTCRRVSTITAEVAVAGSVGGRRLSRGHLIVALAAPSSARIEAPAPIGANIFMFVATDEDAKLLLERDNRVLDHGRPDAVLEALTGVPLDPAGLRQTLTGCSATADWRQARQFGDEWISMPDGEGEIYLKRAASNGSWQLAAAIHGNASSDRWRADYSDVHDGLPRSIHLFAIESARFDLRLALSQVDINTTLGADVFRLRIPPSAIPIDLGELREAGPLGGDGRSNAR